MPRSKSTANIKLPGFDEKHFQGKLLTTYEGKKLSIDAMTIIKEHK